MPRAKSVGLTERQREVLRLIAAGKSNAEIAEALGVSLDGAKYHVSEILSRLGVDSREEAASYWLQQSGLRARFTQALAVLLSGASAAKVAGAVVAVAAVSATVAILVVVLSNPDDESRPSASIPGASASAPGATPTLDAVPASCPAQSSATANSAFRPALGDGPVYVMPGLAPAAGQRTLMYHPPDWRQNFPAGWGGQDVVFFVAPSYQEPIKISGGGFGTSAELQFVGPSETVLLPLDKPPGTGFPVLSVTADGWRNYGTTILFRLDSPGCYALDFTGPGLAQRIVFWADLQPSQPPVTPVSASPTPTPPACSVGAGPVRPIIEWMPFLRLRGRSYLAIGMGFARGPSPQLSVDPARAGGQVGTVLWNVRDPATSPCYSRLDGSTAILEAGTPVFALDGYAEDFRLVGETPYGWRIFEADGLNGAKTAADALDIRGKVLSVTAERQEQSGRNTALGEISDRNSVQKLVDLLLAEPVAFTGTATHPTANDPPQIQLTFRLSDGTVTVRGFYIGGWERSQGFPVTPEFLARLEAYFANAR